MHNIWAAPFETVSSVTNTDREGPGQAVDCCFNLRENFHPYRKKKYFANSLDPDETAHLEPSHQDLHYLPFCFDYD